MSSSRQLMMRQKNKSDDYLAFTAQEANSTISINVTGTPTYNLKYSFDKINWYIFADSATNTINTITLTNIDDIVYIKGIYNKNNVIGYDYSSYIIFAITGKVSISGNLYSILDENNFGNIKNLLNYHRYTFYKLFYECTALTDASNLSLPALILIQDCYNQLFYKCSNLLYAPTLPATTLDIRCYQSMFEGCTKLISTPVLPSIVAKNRCYYNMFKDCKTIVNSPELPALILDFSCYESMFNGCTSLVNAPVLSVTTAANTCYGSMFKGCTSLITAPELPATTLNNYCYSNMFNGCTSLVNAPQQLPATTVYTSSYTSMFENCTSLVKSPEIFATNLNRQCFQWMFRNCTLLNEIKINYTGDFSNSNNEFINWVSGVSATGNFYYNGNDITNFGNNAIPSGWTVHSF